MDNTNTTAGAIIGLIVLLMVMGGMYWWWSSSQAPVNNDTGVETTSTTTSPASSEADVQRIRTVVSEFGRQLQMVSLTASTSTRDANFDRYYGTFVSPELLSRWKSRPATALGRAVSSPWPDRIEIDSVIRIDDNQYAVIGRVIELSSAATTSTTSSENIAATYPITFTIKRQQNDAWFITDLAKGPEIPTPTSTPTSSSNRKW